VLRPITVLDIHRDNIRNRGIGQNDNEKILRNMAIGTNEIGKVDFDKASLKLPQRLTSLDAVRGIGALWVLSFHITHTQPGPVGLRYFVTLPIDFAHLALLFFILISGFCIHFNTVKKSSVAAEPDWRQFWKRRIRRLYPPYFFGVVFSLILRALNSHRSVTLPPSPIVPDLFAHLLMIHNLIPQFIPGVGNPALWSLGLEEQLYALYVPLAKFRKRWSIEQIASSVLILGIAWVVVLTPGTGAGGRADHWWYFWPFTWWFAWTLGALAAEIHVNRVASIPLYHSFPAALSLLSIGFVTSNPILGLFINTNLFASLFGTGLPALIGHILVNISDFFFAGSFFVMMNLLSRAEKMGKPFRFPRFLRWFGLFSYSFYLTHEPIVRLAESYLGNGTAVLEIAFRYLLIVPLCIAISWLFFQLIEKRYLN
jgi:peptidoglycan/LPS O-acetylase OafA/YrhL